MCKTCLGNISPAEEDAAEAAAAAVMVVVAVAVTTDTEKGSWHTFVPSHLFPAHVVAHKFGAALSHTPSVPTCTESQMK